jgi:hypothetical protein
MDDRGSQDTLAPGGRSEPWRRGLSPRAERVARAAIEAMLADEDEAGQLVPPPAHTCDRAVAWLSRATGHTSGGLRVGFNLLTVILQMLPLFVIGAPRRMTSLSLADRVRYLAALETSRFGLLTMLLVAFKVPMGMVAFEEGDELRSTGFDRPSTTSRRRLVWIQEPAAPGIAASAGAPDGGAGRAHGEGGAAA